MSSIKTITVLTLALSTFALTAGEVVKTDPSPHSYTVRPEFVFDSQKTECGKIKSFHMGGSFDYEYTRDDNFFYGVNSTALLGNVSVDFKDGWINYKRSFNPLTLASEGVGGYHFALPHDIDVSPFGGVGAVFFLADADRLGVNNTVFYGVLGFKSMYHYSPALSFGLNAQFFHAFRVAGRTHSNTYSAWVPFADAWGYEIGIPIHYFPAKLKGFGFEIEPKIKSFGNRYAAVRPGLTFNCVFKY